MFVSTLPRATFDANPQLWWWWWMVVVQDTLLLFRVKHVHFGAKGPAEHIYHEGVSLEQHHDGWWLMLMNENTWMSTILLDGCCWWFKVDVDHVNVSLLMAPMLVDLLMLTMVTDWAGEGFWLMVDALFTDVHHDDNQGWWLLVDVWCVDDPCWWCDAVHDVDDVCRCSLIMFNAWWLMLISFDVCWLVLMMLDGWWTMMKSGSWFALDVDDGPWLRVCGADLWLMNRWRLMADAEMILLAESWCWI